MWHWLKPSFWRLSPHDKVIYQLRNGPQSYDTEALLATAEIQDQVALSLKLLELQKKYGRVDPEIAKVVEKTLREEPFGEIVIEYRPEGFDIRIDHNPDLIKALKEKGYSGTDQEVTEQWMLDVCRSILTEDGVEALEYLNSGTVPSIVRTDDGKVTYS